MQAGYSLTTGVDNTFVGGSKATGSGSAITSGSKNTILGCYNGNQGGLDIRTSSNYIVLSDGDGNPRGYSDGSGNWTFAGQVNAGSSITGGTVTANVNGVNFSGNNYAASGASTFFNMYLSGTQQFYITNAGSIFTRGSTSISAISDRSLKTNIVDIPYGLETINALTPRQFDWAEGQGSGRTGELGFIAQEVAEVLPQITDEFGDSGLLGLRHADLIPVLVKAIHELKTIVDAQAAEIAELKAKVA